MECAVFSHRGFPVVLAEIRSLQGFRAVQRDRQMVFLCEKSGSWWLNRGPVSADIRPEVKPSNYENISQLQAVTVNSKIF